MNIEKKFQAFGLTEATMQQVYKVMSLQYALSKVTQTLTAEISSYKDLVVLQVANALIERVTPLGEQWVTLFNKYGTEAVNNVIQIDGRSVGFSKQGYFQVSAQLFTECASTKQEFIDVVNKAFGTTQDTLGIAKLWSNSKEGNDIPITLADEHVAFVLELIDPTEEDI